MTPSLNCNYNFARTVFTMFDEAQPQNKRSRTDQNELLKKIILSKTQGDLVATTIATSSIKNTSDWLYVSGQLGTGKERLSAAVTDKLARNIFDQLGLTQPKSEPSKRLWEHVFCNTYANATVENKEKIISLAREIDSQAMEVCKYQIRMYKVLNCIAKIFDNTFMKFAVSFMIYTQLHSLKKYVVTSIKIVAIPRIINSIINIFPLIIIRQMNWVIKGAENLYNYRIIIWLGASLLKCCGCERLGWVAGKISDLLFLPYTMTIKISSYIWELTMYSYKGQRQISQSLEAVADDNLRAKLELGGQNALKVWMKVSNQALNQGGITRLISVPS